MDAVSANMRVLVVGCGAVGTMCAFALQKSGVATVTALLRSNFALVQEKGLHIRSIDHGEIDHWRPHNIIHSLDEAAPYGPFDYVLVALKNLPDVYAIADVIRPVVTPGQTAIVLVQNGIGIEQPVADAFSGNAVLSGVAMIGAELTGREVLHNDPDLLYLAPWSNSGCQVAPEAQNAACRAFADAYNRGGARCEVIDNLHWHRWRKLVWNASFNTVCALLSLDSGTVQDAAGSLDTLVRPAMREIVALAAADGAVLPANIVETMVAMTPKDVCCRPSMQVDAERRRPMEVEVILGNPLRRGRELGVATPVLQTLYHLLQAKQWAFLHGK